MAGTSPAMTKSSTAVFCSRRLRHRLAQRGDLEVILMVADRACDEACGDRGAVIVHDRHQPHRIDAVLVDDQLPQLAVAVLLDDVDEVVVGNEARDTGMEREGADAQAVEMMSL